jgi:hypothetical protein
VPDRRALLVAALGFVQLRRAERTPALAALQRWLGSWRGIGAIVAGMDRQGYDLELSRLDGLGWRASFYVTGRIHSFTEATGTAFEPTPWRAVQRAAWLALRAGGTMS